jgi:hypothetical protein
MAGQSAHRALQLAARICFEVSRVRSPKWVSVSDSPTRVLFVSAASSVVDFVALFSRIDFGCNCVEVNCVPLTDQMCVSPPTRAGGGPPSHSQAF